MRTDFQSDDRCALREGEGNRRGIRSSQNTGVAYVPLSSALGTFYKRDDRRGGGNAQAELDQRTRELAARDRITYATAYTRVLK